MPTQIHPAAECFRMMTEEELAALAADISENGQRDPIVLGIVNGAATAVLIDGRNRERACEMIKVEPYYETLEFESDEEVRAFVKSRGERRNSTKGQMAMAVAWLYPEPEKGGRGNKSKNSKETLGFTPMRLSQARKVLAFSRELAVAVRDGGKTLDEALKEVEASQRSLQTADEQRAMLRAEAPDLAELADEERLALVEALAALDKRRAQEREQREATLRLIANAVDAIAAFASDTFVEAAAQVVSSDNGRGELEKRLGTQLNVEMLRRGCSALIATLENGQ